MLKGIQAAISRHLRMRSAKPAAPINCQRKPWRSLARSYAAKKWSRPKMLLERFSIDSECVFGILS
jgi:hypothetical protein